MNAHLLAAEQSPTLDYAATAFVIVCASLVLLMTPALALFYGGMTRAKSVLNMLMMSLGGFAVVAVLFQAGLYSIDGQKMVLLLPAAVLGMYFFARSRRTLHSGLTVAIVTVMMLIVLLTFWLGWIILSISLMNLRITACFLGMVFGLVYWLGG